AMGNKISTFMCLKRVKKSDKKLGQLADYSGLCVSSRIVTGPSLINDTCISAPKTPACTGSDRLSESCARKYSYKGMATCGAAAAVKPGRFPFLVLANSVN